jgi:hypothetical protein
MTHPSAADKWTAFLLSLLAPGVGQLFAGHWSFAVWFLIAVAVGTLLPAGAGLSLLVLVGLGLASAEHAKRCLEPAPSPRHLRRRVTCEGTRGMAVRLRIELEIPHPAGEVWRIVADLARFVTADPFHCRVVVLGPSLRPGVALALEHAAFGGTLWRFGRLLWWRDGSGYAFSDLSARGPRRGFPHIFVVTVRPAGDERSVLEVQVRGKWTAGWLPRWLRDGWLRYVCHEHARLLSGLFPEEKR